MKALPVIVILGLTAFVWWALRKVLVTPRIGDSSRISDPEGFLTTGQPLSALNSLSDILTSDSQGLDEWAWTAEETARGWR